MSANWETPDWDCLPDGGWWQAGGRFGGTASRTDTWLDSMRTHRCIIIQTTHTHIYIISQNAMYGSRPRAHTRSIPTVHTLILTLWYCMIHTLDPYPFLVEERLLLALMLLFIRILFLVLVLLLPLLLLPPLPPRCCSCCCCCCHLPPRSCCYCCRFCCCSCWSRCWCWFTSSVCFW